MHCAHPLVDAEVEPEVGVKVESHAQAEVKNILEEAEAEVESKAEAEVKSEFEFEFERRRSRPRWRLRLWCSPGGHPLHKWPWFGLAVSEFFCCFFCGAHQPDGAQVSFIFVLDSSGRGRGHFSFFCRGAPPLGLGLIKSGWPVGHSTLFSLWSHFCVFSRPICLTLPFVSKGVRLIQLNELTEHKLIQPLSELRLWGGLEAGSGE